MKRQPGRPPLDEDDPSAQISVTLPSKQLAAICDQAQRDRLTVPEWIRLMLKSSGLPNKKT